MQTCHLFFSILPPQVDKNATRVNLLGSAMYRQYYELWAGGWLKCDIESGLESSDKRGSIVNHIPQLCSLTAIATLFIRPYIPPKNNRTLILSLLSRVS